MANTVAGIGAAVAAVACFGVAASSRFSQAARITAAGVGALATMSALYQLLRRSPCIEDKRVSQSCFEFLRDAGYDRPNEVVDIGAGEDPTIFTARQPIVWGTRPKDNSKFVAIRCGEKGEQRAIFFPEMLGDEIGIIVGSKETLSRGDFKKILDGQHQLSVTPAANLL